MQLFARHPEEKGHREENHICRARINCSVRAGKSKRGRSGSGLGTDRHGRQHCQRHHRSRVGAAAERYYSIKKQLIAGNLTLTDSEAATESDEELIRS